MEKKNVPVREFRMQDQRLLKNHRTNDYYRITKMVILQAKQLTDLLQFFQITSYSCACYYAMI